MTGLFNLATTGGLHRPAILALLIATYAGIAVGRVPGLKIDRTGIALLGAIAVMIFSGVPAGDMAGYVNWPAILLLFGFFVIAAQLQLCGFYDHVAGAISVRLGQPARFLLVLMLVTAGLSAFLNHDIVCLVFTPVVGAALLRHRRNPVPFLIGLAIASNIGGAATPIGNPQDMLIAQVAGLSFGRYVRWSFVPVAIALAAAYGLIWWLSRKTFASPEAGAPEHLVPPREFDRAHTIKGLVILIGVIELFFLDLPKEVIAVGTACSLLPFFGFTSLFNLGIGLWLRLNQAILQTLNQLLGPVQLALILVYVRLGEKIWGAPPVPLSVSTLVQSFHANPAAFLQRFGWTGVHAATAWLLTVPFIVAGLYFPLRPVLRKFSRQAASAQ